MPTNVTPEYKKAKDTRIAFSLCYTLRTILSCFMEPFSTYWDNQIPPNDCIYCKYAVESIIGWSIKSLTKVSFKCDD